MSVSPRSVLIVAAVIALAVALALWARPNGETTHTAPDEPDAAFSNTTHARPAAGPDAPAPGISGTIRDLDGTPLAGAHVCAWRLGPAWLLAERAAPQCSEAGPDGFYTLTGLSPLRHAIHASAPHHRPARLDHDMSLRPGEHRGGVDLALAPGGVRVTGVVQDLSGGIVEGAWVLSGDGRDLGTAATRSDAAGRFALWVRPGLAHLFAQADGYADASDHGNAPGDSFTLVLTPESVIVGRVIAGDTREPLAGARVTVIGDLGEGGVVGMGIAFTDAAGNFRLARLQPGRYKPTVQAQGRHGEAERSIHLGLGETSEPLTIAVHPVATASGRIAVKGETGGCPRGEVYLTARAGLQTLVESTDDSGAVAFAAIRPDTYDVQIACPGYVVPTVFSPVVVGQASVTGLVWEISTGRAIRGTVVDARGQPVPGVGVSAYTETPVTAAQGQGFGVDEATDAAGTFEIAGLLPGEYLVGIHSEELNSLPDRVRVSLVPDRDVAGVQIALPEYGELHGVVVDDRGEPAPRIMVVIHDAEMTTSTLTGADGAFVVAGLRPGEYRVHATRPGPELVVRGEPVAGELPVRVVADATADLRLVVAGAHAQIRGRVVHADGNPVTDAFVVATREQPGLDPRMELRWGGFDRPVLTDADGSFTIEDLVEGNHALRAYRRGGGEALVEHVATGTTTTLTITPTAEIGGTLGSTPPDEFAMYIVDPATMVQRTEEFYRTQGRWGFDALPAGTYELYFEAALGTAKHTVTLRPDERRTDLRVTLDPPGRIRGRVIDAASEAPVADLRLRATPMASKTRFGVGSEEVPSDGDGRFEIADVRAGPVNLSARADDPSRAGVGGDLQVDVEPGRTVEVTLTVADRHGPPAP